MKTHKVINEKTKQEYNPMTVFKCLNLYDSLGGSSKGWKITKI